MTRPSSPPPVVSNLETAAANHPVGDWAPPTAIHSHPCVHCPSAHAERLGDHDPESLDYKSASRADQLKSVFRCGWRPTKACKGYCDFLGVVEADLLAHAAQPEASK